MLNFTEEPGKAKYLSLNVTHQISAFSKALVEFIKIVLVPSCLSFLERASPCHFSLNPATFEKSSKASL